MALTRKSHIGPVPAWLSETYWSAFRRDVFTLIQLGHQRLASENLSTAAEEHITGELSRAIEALLDEPHAPDWFNSYAIHEEPRLHSSHRKGKRRQRMDIRIECSDQRPRPHYEFEAKRLSGGKFKCSHYVGPEGLGAFLTGEYAARWLEAGMLGYVQSESIDHWEQALACRIAVSGDPASGGSWQPARIISELFTYRSRHLRALPLEPIAIYHALLPFWEGSITAGDIPDASGTV